MTSVMRSVSTHTGKRVLRIALVEQGRIVDERLIRERITVTVGPSERAMFVVPTRSLPAAHPLFELEAGRYRLNLLAGMTGRVAQETGVVDLSSAPESRGTPGQRRVHLSDIARGKIVVGTATFLFQFTDAPPPSPKPQLPMAVKQGLAGDIDWFTTVVAAFSFLLHFLAVAALYSDWTDPVVDDALTVQQLVESVESLPPPPIEKPAVAADTGPAKPDSSADTKSDASKPQDKHRGVASKGPSQPSGPAHAPPGGDANSEQIAEIENQLRGLDVGLVAAFDDHGASIDNVLGDGEIPLSNLDEAGRREQAARAGVPGGLDLGDGDGRTLTPGELVARTSDPASTTTNTDSTDKPQEDEVKPPDGTAVVSPPSVAGGTVPGASGTVSRMRGGFRSCYLAGLRKNPTLQGSVTLVAKIGPNGNVMSVSGGGGPLAPITGCLKSIVRSGGFNPPTSGGGAVIAIPITFRLQ